MRLLFIGCLTFFLEFATAAVHPIEGVSISTHADVSYLEAEVFLKNTCVELNGNTLLFDSRRMVITLMQQVKNNSQKICAQLMNPKTTEFALKYLPLGVYTIVDGYDEQPLGELLVSANGVIDLLEE